MNRRALLRRAGAIGTLGLLAGCPALGPSREEAPTPTGTPDGETTTSTASGKSVDVPEAYTEQFDRVVDVVAAGADPGGTKPINGVLHDVVADDTLVYFPEGRYLLDGHWVREQFANIGFYGPNATVVPPQEYKGHLFVFGGGPPSSGLVFDGFSFDIRAENTGPRVLHVTVADGLLVRDLTVTGVQDTDTGLSRFDITDPEGQGRVERISMPHGGEPGTVATGSLVGSRCEGELTFVDCHIEGFPDNGLYASPAPGIVRVLGGRYANNGIANVRVSDGSEVRGVHVVCDEAPEGVPNMRGIRLREGDGALVDQCLVELTDVTSSDGAITLSTGMGSGTVRNTEIRVDVDGVPAIRAKPPSAAESNGSDARLHCENVSIVGSAAEGRSIQVVGRDESAFEGLCLRQTGANRDGLYFLHSTGSLVADSQVDVTGDPVVSRNSTVRTRRLRTGNDANCDADGNRTGSLGLSRP